MQRHLTGVVTRDQNKKTRRVEVARLYRHPKYGKISFVPGRFLLFMMRPRFPEGRHVSRSSNVGQRSRRSGGNWSR